MILLKRKDFHRFRPLPTSNFYEFRSASFEWLPNELSSAPLNCIACPIFSRLISCRVFSFRPGHSGKVVIMARWARHLVVLLLLTLSVGCVTVRSPWTFRSPFVPVPRKFEQPAEEQPAVERPSAEHHAEHESRSEEEKEERGPFIASASADDLTGSSKGASTAGLNHDPATRMLIEEELRDASLDERAEWITFLGTVETSEVAGLLKERRIAMRRESELIAEGTQKSHPSGIMPAAHSLSAETATPPQKSANDADAMTPETEAGESAETITGGVSSTGAAWQKKFRSFADPNRLWPHSSAETAEPPEHSVTAAISKGERPGRPPFRSRRQDPSAEATQLPEITPAAQADSPPQQTASLETRITPGSALWEDEMAKLISLLEAEASSTPVQESSERNDLRKQVGLRMLYLIANEPQKSFQAIPGLPPEEQEFWTSLFLGLSEHLDQTGANDPGARATQTIAHLRTAAYHLQQSANLRMRNLTFCQQINGFGNYETFSADQFSAGQTVLIYAEIRNFKSVPIEESYYLTRIRSTIEIYTTRDGQRLVDRSTYDPTEDRSRTMRTDYYHSYRLDLPANLSPGPHLVKLILQDELTGKQTTESLPFLVK